MVANHDLPTRRVNRASTFYQLGCALGVTAALSVLVLLGLWQLQRAQEKQMLVDSYEARMNAKSVQVSQTRMAPGLAYFPAQVKGHFETQYQILLDNRVHEGRVGYDVLTPFRIQNGHMRILVNRGWVPMGPSRSRLPLLDTPGQAQVISGHLYRPPERYFSLEKVTPTLADKVWQNLDLERFHTEAGYPLQPYVVRLDVGLPGAYQRFSPNYSDQWVDRHRGYALQWFGLALVLLIGSAVFAWTHRVKH